MTRTPISATVALCEAAAYYKKKGMTLWDAMIDMYEKYGYYNDAVKSIGLSGIEGLAKIQSIMDNLRNNTPTEVGGYKVVSARDYKLDTIKDMATGEVKPTGLPSSNVLYYDMERRRMGMRETVRHRAEDQILLWRKGNLP